MSWTKDYPRDLIGYGRKQPHAQWPQRAKIAINFVLNYEEGSENSVLHGDAGSETFLSEISGAAAFDARHLSMESMYEYGSRVGVWRILREFAKRNLPLTVFGVAMALQRHREATSAFCELGHEIASHGNRWIHHQYMSEAEERAQIAAASSIIRDLSGGQWPFGWYTGRDSPNTKRLVLEHGGFEYDSDYYGDDLPFYLPVEMSDGSVQRQLIVPYTLDVNDMKFSSPAGFANGQDFAQYLIDTFDVLYSEGEECPKMMSVGMHCRLLGKPARMAGLMKFLDHIEKHDRVWVARRIDIARHWRAVHPYAGEVR
ncbi:MAG: allantoinase PuuE [Burkholderiales bacterium]|nr:allantoinase PuuE [Burkholderiales bacterium]